ncbi:hypothetical protein F5Y14DRAFT_405601 [Nemania sp. NC0429]|nr:hypothetical protein F5Y14DRAFT_405601 [Nemania sp. NC0429]
MSENQRQVLRDHPNDPGSDQIPTQNTGPAPERVPVPSANSAIIVTHEQRDGQSHTDAVDVEWSSEAHPDEQRGNRGPVERMKTAEQQANKKHLFLVRQHQSAGQPMHWSLAVAPENGGTGDIYQVKGDAVYMCYQRTLSIDIFASSSYADCHRLCALDAAGQSSVARVASQVRPPRAASQAEAQVNCQDWAVQVIRRLEDLHVVPPGSAAKCASWYDYDKNGSRLLG